jgi:hypothetical protein
MAYIRLEHCYYLLYTYGHSSLHRLEFVRWNDTRFLRVSHYTSPLPNLLVLIYLSILGVYYTNTWNTGYLPINSNRTWDNTGSRFNVSLVLNAEGEFDYDKYQQYSEPWMAAGNLMIYMWFFAGYTASE